MQEHNVHSPKFIFVILHKLLAPCSEPPLFFPMSTLPDYFDNDDSPFADDPASGDNTFSNPLVLQHSHLNQCCVHAPPTTVSGTSASSLQSDPMQMPPPSSVPSAPPKSSGLSPGAITKIPLAELFHNPEFLKEHERANSLQHMVTLLVAELVDLQHLNKFKLMIGTSFAFFFGALWLIQMSK
jgi:hypothetical protein